MMVYAAEKKKHVVIAVVNKATTDEKLGINLIKVPSGRFRVGPLSPTSPFQHTELREGMEVKTINGVEVEGKEMPSVMGILKNCVGRIIIAAETDKLPSPAVPKKRRSVVAVVNKISQEEKLGINVQKLTTGGFVVGSLTPTSPFQHTELRAGMTIKSINGVNVEGRDMPSVTVILRKCIGSIIVLAETDDPPSYAATDNAPTANANLAGKTTKKPLGRIIIAVVNKATADDELGIQLVRTADGDFFVSMISPESIFKQTDLGEGMRVVSINGVELDNKDMEFVMAILRGAVGTMILAAETEQDTNTTTHHHQQQLQQPQNRRYVIADVNKTTADEPLGIHIVQQQLSNGQNAYIVESIEPFSPFRQTDLREGMTIESINGIYLNNNNNANNAQDWRMAMEIMRSTVGSIIILAETDEPPYATVLPSSSSQEQIEEPTVTATSVVDLPPAYASGFGTTTTDTTTDSTTDATTDATTDTTTLAEVNIRTIAAVVNKTSVDDDLGIHFVQNRQGDTVVLHLTRNSPFRHQTELGEGMKVISINGTDVQGKSVEFCMILVATAEGTVIVAAEKEESPPLAFASLVPENNNHRNNNSNNSNSHNNDTVVDAVPMGASATVIHDQADETTTAPAEDKTVTVVAYKTSFYQPLGIAFERSSDGIFSISQINADSPFASLALTVGMKVLSINHVEVTGQDMSFPLLLLRESPDQVILTAAAAHPSPSPPEYYC